MKRAVVRGSWLLLLMAAGCTGGIGEWNPADVEVPRDAGSPKPMVPSMRPPTTPPPPVVEPPAAPPTTAGFVRYHALSWEQYDHAISALVGRAVTPSKEFAFPAAEPSSYGWLHQAADFDPDITTLERMEEGAAKYAAELARTLTPCAATDVRCIDAFVSGWGKRVWRRPLTTDEAGRLKAIYGKAAADPKVGPADATLLTLEYLLRSHHFFMRGEMGDGRVNRGLVRLTDHETASSLSFALWNRPPDAELAALADAGRLQDPLVIRAQIKRLLGHANANGAFYTFVSQWLGFHDVADLMKDVKTFPSFQPGRTGSLMETETRAFLADFFQSTAPTFANLLNAPASFPPKELGWVYGLTTTGQRIATPNRKGLLMQPSFLATQGSLSETSPTLRGVFVVKKLACFEPPPPDPNAIGLNPEPDPTKTTRERFAEHTKSPACAACHRFFDPIGLAFETFDGVGRHRTTENGKPIDPTGELAAGVLADKPVPFRHVNDVIAALESSPVVQACVVRQAFQFFHARHEAAADEPLLARVLASFARSGLDLKVMITDLMSADEAWLRRVAP